MSREAMLKRSAGLRKQLARLAKLCPSGGIVTLSTEHGVEIATLNRIALVDYRVKESIDSEGKNCGWDAWQYYVYTDGTEKPVECRTVDTEVQAWAICERWLHDADQRKEKPSRLIGPEPPDLDCGPINQSDQDDVANKKVEVLERLYPKLFECFNRISSGSEGWTPERIKDETEKAFLLDAATISGNVATKVVPGDAEFILALARAIERHNKRTRAAGLLKLDFQIAWGWISLGYCFLTQEQLADEINNTLKTNYTAKQLAMRRARGIRLASKRREGRQSRIQV